MATIADLASSGALARLDPGLPPNTQEFRCIYIAPNLQTRLEGDLLVLESAWGVELAPIEQLQSRVEDFCSGVPLIYGEHIRHLIHHRNMVWELKTADLRMFGFFNKKDVFIAVACDCATRIKQYDLYHGYCEAVAHFCDNLSLDEPKFIFGKEPDDVVSTCRYP